VDRAVLCVDSMTSPMVVFVPYSVGLIGLFTLFTGIGLVCGSG